MPDKVDKTEGWIEWEIEDGEGTVHRIRLGVDDNGNIELEAEAPDGTTKSGKIDPSGGSTSLGV